MKHKKILAMALAIAMSVGCLPATAFAETVEDTAPEEVQADVVDEQDAQPQDEEIPEEESAAVRGDVETYGDPQTDTIEYNGITFNVWTESNSLPAGEGNWYLDQDVTLASPWYPTGEVNLLLNGHDISCTALGYDPCIEVLDGCKLSIYENNANPGTIGGSQGGITVSGSESYLYLYGGNISRNVYSGVTVGGSGYFIMEGGTIEGNTNSGVLVGSGGTFVMFDGTISGNQAIMEAPYGGGVQIRDGVMFMSGGTIEGNSAQYGGGISIYRTSSNYSPYVEISGGRITGNTTTSDYKGFNHDGQFGGTGGGIYVQDYGQDAIIRPVRISGAPYILGNKYSDGTANNIALAGFDLTINGRLSDDARIGVCINRFNNPDYPVFVITENWDYPDHGNNNKDVFVSDRTDLKIDVFGTKYGSETQFYGEVCVYDSSYFDSKITGYTMTAGNTISLNYYVWVGSSALVGTNNDIYPYMTFTVDGVAKDPIYLDQTNYDSQTRIAVFSCPLDATEIDAEIQANFSLDLSTGTESLLTDDADVSDYAEEVLKDSTVSEEAKEVMESILCLNEFADSYWGNGQLSDEAVASIENVDLSEITPSFNVASGSTHSEYYGSSLVLLSKITLKHYFTLPEGVDESNIEQVIGWECSDPSVQCGIPEINGNYFSIEIPGINVADMEKLYNVTVHIGGSETILVTYSPLDYFVRLNNNPNASDDLKDFARAFYAYYKKVDAYAATL